MCNMCLFENEVDPSYFCNLDMNGRRLDLDQRPELRNGTIEFAVPKEYWNKTPAPAAYVFAIDVSWNAIQSGMLAQAVEGIKNAVWDESGVSRLVPGAQIGILTYDKNIHFYNLSVSTIGIVIIVPIFMEVAFSRFSLLTMSYLSNSLV